MIERCGHQPCGSDNREQYCTVEAQDPRGAAGATVALMDDVMYNTHHLFPGTQVSCDKDGLRMSRTFNYYDGDTETWVWPLTETNAQLTHKMVRGSKVESYYVSLGWRVHQEGVAANKFLSHYTIKKLGEDCIYGVIDSHNVITGELEEREMTSYDYTQLYDALSDLQDLQIAEDYDNTLSSYLNHHF